MLSKKDLADGVIYNIFSENLCTLSFDRFFNVMYLKHHMKSSLSDQNFAVKSGSKNSCLIPFFTLSEPGEAGFAADTPNRLLCCNFMFLLLFEGLNFQQHISLPVPVTNCSGLFYPHGSTIVGFLWGVLCLNMKCCQ